MRPTPPEKFSHFGIYTRNVAQIRDWWCSLLGAHVTVEHIPNFSTITFDEEHHRIAIIALPEEKVAPKSEAGIFHTAFTHPNMASLLAQYEFLKSVGILPVETRHHGPTVSFYYEDPDGNECELQVERFNAMEDAKAFMRGPVFAHTLGSGGHFDADAMLARFKAGASEEELVGYDENAALRQPPGNRR